MYRWIVFLHAISALAFMAAHGVSILVCFRVKRARTVAEIRPLLDLSSATLGATLGSFALVSLTGLVAGVWGGWWRNGWFWLSVVILIGILVLMATQAAMPFHRIRRAAGLPYVDQRRRPQPPLAEPDIPEMLAAIDGTRPIILAIVGLGGVAVLTWLMMFKPF